MRYATANKSIRATFGKCQILYHHFAFITCVLVLLSATMQLMLAMKRTTELLTATMTERVCLNTVRAVNSSARKRPNAMFSCCTIKHTASTSIPWMRKKGQRHVLFSERLTHNTIPCSAISTKKMMIQRGLRLPPLRIWPGFPGAFRIVWEHWINRCGRANPPHPSSCTNSQPDEKPQTDTRLTQSRSNHLPGWKLT